MKLIFKRKKLGYEFEASVLPHMTLIGITSLHFSFKFSNFLAKTENWTAGRSACVAFISRLFG